MENRKFLKSFYVFASVIALCFACIAPADVHAGGVHFGFGVNVPLGSEPVPPPIAAYGPPVVVERPVSPPPVVVERPVPVPAPVMVERTAPPPVVVVRRASPTVVYEGPVVVEKRSTTYYYPPSYQAHSYREETEREYFRQRSSTYEYAD